MICGNCLQHGVNRMHLSQGDHLCGKTANVGEFGHYRGNIRKLTILWECRGKTFLWGEQFIANFVFGFFTQCAIQIHALHHIAFIVLLSLI